MAKTSLKSSAIIWNLDIHCFRGHCPSYNTSSKMQTQGSKNSFCPKKLKPKNLKSTLSRDNAVKLPKKNNRKDKKKRFRGQRQKHTREQKKQTSITSVNTINVLKKRRKSVALIRLHVSIAIRKATLPATALSQKTCINLGNLYAGDWWWWKSC